MVSTEKLERLWVLQEREGLSFFSHLEFIMLLQCFSKICGLASDEEIVFFYNFLYRQLWVLKQGKEYIAQCLKDDINVTSNYISKHHFAYNLGDYTGVPRKYKLLDSSCEGALVSKSLFTVDNIGEILTWILRPPVFKLGLYSQSNLLKLAKFLRQPRADSSLIMQSLSLCTMEEAFGAAKVDHSGKFHDLWKWHLLFINFHCYCHNNI